MKIKVLMMPADRKAYITNIEDTLENLQRTVGGYIEAVKLSADAVLVCNEDGKLLGLPRNKNISGKLFKPDMIVGDCFICGCNGEDFTDITDGAKRLFLASCRAAWEENNE